MILAIIWGVIGFIAGAGSCWFFLVHLSKTMMTRMTKDEYLKVGGDALEEMLDFKFKDDPIENGINAWKEFGMVNGIDIHIDKQEKEKEGGVIF